MEAYYKVLSFTSSALLEQEVNKYVKQGYKPVGGIAVVYNANASVSTVIYAQALYREATVKP